MATLTIRNLSDDVHAFLRRNAADHGSSVEAEVRHILEQTMVRHETRPGEVAKRIHTRFAKIGGADDLALPPHASLPEPPALGE